MDHLKEQLKKHYEKTQPTEGFLQKLHTLEAPEPAPVPIPMRRKRLLAPIAAMLIAAVAILGGGKYLMDMVPPTAAPPEIAVESAVGFDDICYGAADAPTSVPEYSAAPDVPEMYHAEDPVPEETPPEPGSADVTAPQPSTSPEPTDPAPPEDITDPKPPIEVEGSADDPTPPSDDDVPPHDPGDDDPPTEPDINAPADEPDKPVDPPSDPVDPPDEPGNPPDDPVNPPDDPVNPPSDPSDPLDEPIYPDLPPGFGDNAQAGAAGEHKPPQSAILGHYANENGQHIVYLANFDTGETITLNLTSQITADGYHGIHNLFGSLIYVSLYPKSPSDPVDSPASGLPNGFVLKLAILDKA